MDAELLALPRLQKARGEVIPPGSKSIANRVLPMAALGRGTLLIGNVPDGDDVTLMLSALSQLGVGLRREGAGVWIEGRGGPFEGREARTDLQLGNSGTCVRFLSALVCAGNGDYTVDGVARMRERPVADLVDALRQLAGAAGTAIAYSGADGFPPLEIRARGLAGGRARVRGDLSSQFLTGLLLALPLCRGAATVEVEGELVSRPYVDMTLALQRLFGADLTEAGPGAFQLDVPAGYVNPPRFEVEPDASSASYFLAAGALGGGPVTVRGIGADSLQGEAGFARVLARMGAKVEWGGAKVTVTGGTLAGIEADMGAMTDTGMTLAVLALFARGRTRITGIGNWRLKETDRIAAVAAELRKLGARVEAGADFLAIDPPATIRPAVIDTYGDHRMAMAFSLAAFSGADLSIRDPGCVRKTYPCFFEDLLRVAGVA